MKNPVNPSVASKPYHHGDLHNSLLSAARNILETQGLDALSLRAAARDAGVSHAAPKNHFSDMTGLLSELAASGFREFGSIIDDIFEADMPSVQARMRAMARAYAGYARAHPAMFILMFRSDRLDMSVPTLHQAYLHLRYSLAKVLAQCQGVDLAALGPSVSSDMDDWHPEPGSPMAESIIGSWAMVHGFSMLLIDRRLDPALVMNPDPERAWEGLLESALNTLIFFNKP